MCGCILFRNTKWYFRVKVREFVLSFQVFIRKYSTVLKCRYGSRNCMSIERSMCYLGQTTYNLGNRRIISVATLILWSPKSFCIAKMNRWLLRSRTYYLNSMTFSDKRRTERTNATLYPYFYRSQFKQILNVQSQ